MRITYFSESERPLRVGVSLVLPLLTACPRSQGHQDYWFAPAAAPRGILHEQPATPIKRLARRAARPVLAVYQPEPATVEELTRDLAGWSLPQAAPLGRASASWLW